MSCCRCPLQVRYRRRASVCNVFWLALLGLQGASWQKQKNPMSCCRCHLQVRYRRRASVCAISFGLPCWACKEQVGKSKMHNWVWLGLAKFARCMPRARFCPGVRANSFSETMLPGLNWWAYIIMTA